MPTKIERVKTLTEIGLLPYSAQEIVDTEALAPLTNAAVTSLQDFTRAQAFVLYSKLIPDWLRNVWSALALADLA